MFHRKYVQIICRNLSGKFQQESIIFVQLHSVEDIYDGFLERFSEKPFLRAFPDGYLFIADTLFVL